MGYILLFANIKRFKTTIMSTLKQRILQATQARLSMEAVEWDDDGTLFCDIARVISE